MTVESWLEAAVADAERRGLAPLKALLETLARSTAALRAADAELRSIDQAPNAPKSDPGRER
jgi:hypothetical protein